MASNVVSVTVEPQHIHDDGTRPTMEMVEGYNQAPSDEFAFDEAIYECADKTCRARVAVMVTISRSQPARG